MALSDLETVTNESSYAVGETVDPDEQILNEEAIKSAVNSVISELKKGSVVEKENTYDFTGQQTFSGGIKVNAVQNVSSGSDIVVTVPGAKLKYGGTTDDHELTTVSAVNALIAALTGTNYDIINGGVKTASFTAVASTRYDLDFSVGDIEVTLPASPSAGDVVAFRNYLSTDGTTTSGRVLKLISASHNVQNGTSTSGDPETLDDFKTLYIEYDTTKGWLML